VLRRLLCTVSQPATVCIYQNDFQNIQRTFVDRVTRIYKVICLLKTSTFWLLEYLLFLEAQQYTSTLNIIIYTK